MITFVTPVFSFSYQTHIGSFKESGPKYSNSLPKLSPTLPAGKKDNCLINPKDCGWAEFGTGIQDSALQWPADFFSAEA